MRLHEATALSALDRRYGGRLALRAEIDRLKRLKLLDGKSEGYVGGAGGGPMKISVENPQTESLRMAGTGNENPKPRRTQPQLMKLGRSTRKSTPQEADLRRRLFLYWLSIGWTYREIGYITGYTPHRIQMDITAYKVRNGLKGISIPALAAWAIRKGLIP